MVNKIRLVFIITDLNTGGAEMMLYRLLQSINYDLFDCQVISLSANGPVGTRIQLSGIPVITLDMPNHWFNPLGWIKLIFWLAKEKPDLVQTVLYHADLMGGLAAWINGIPVIWNIHNLSLHNHSKKATQWIVKICARLSKTIPTLIISCSQKAREYHIHLGYRSNQFEVIPNGFDINLLKPDEQARSLLHQELGLDSETMVIGHIARFDPQKDHQMLIKAAGLLISRFPKVKFMLCGDGITWENEELAGWINESGLKDFFQLAGRRDDINKILPGFDLVVSSSIGEAFPMILGEAMACGTPCVATDVGDSGLIIGETGIVVPPGDPKGLAEGMEKMLSLSREERQKLGGEARQRVVDHFNLPDITARYEAYYLKILGRA